MENRQEQVAELERRAKRYLKENDLLLKKHKLNMRIVINFPRSKNIPFFAKIAMWILNKKGGSLDIQFGAVVIK